MKAAGQQDHEGLGLGVDPEAGAREARVTQAVGPEKGPAGAAVAGLHIPAQAATLAIGSRSGIEHGPYRQRAQEPRAARSDAVGQKRLGEESQVVGSREKTGMTGHPS